MYSKMVAWLFVLYKILVFTWTGLFLNVKEKRYVVPDGISYFFLFFFFWGWGVHINIQYSLICASVFKWVSGIFNSRIWNQVLWYTCDLQVLRSPFPHVAPPFSQAGVPWSLSHYSPTQPSDEHCWGELANIGLRFSQPCKRPCSEVPGPQAADSHRLPAMF